MIQYIWQDNIGIGSVTGNIWSRSARRKRQEEIEDKDEVRLGFRIRVNDEGDRTQVVIEWRIGTDVILFESFGGKIKSIVQHQ
jgi:hypothetical protein